MDFVIKVMPKGEIELPDEIKAQLRPGDEYQVFLIENSIVLKKNTERVRHKRMVSPN